MGERHIAQVRENTPNITVDPPATNQHSLTRIRLGGFDVGHGIGVGQLAALRSTAKQLTVTPGKRSCWISLYLALK